VNIEADREERILSKAAHVERAVTTLLEKRSLTIEEYRGDREQRAIVEREFQTAIEACIDIAGILLAATEEPMPATNAGRFVRLEDQDILSAETGRQMQQAAGFRNILVHRYGDEIDDAVVYEHLQSELEWIVRYLREVRAVLGNDE